VDRNVVTDLVEREMAAAADPAVAAIIGRLRVEPYPVELAWVYGPAERYACWVVLDGLPWNGNVGVVYCGEGFGPDRPWGLVFLRGPHPSMGMSDNWYATLGDFVYENWAPDGGGDSARESVSMNEEAAWEAVKHSLPAGARVRGVVTRHFPFGIFIDLEGVPFTGLVEIPEFKDEGRMTPEEYPHVGARIEAVVLGFKESGRQIWLSMRPSRLGVQPEPTG
jgi:S1 RNA binding domain